LTPPRLDRIFRAAMAPRQPKAPPKRLDGGAFIALRLNALIRESTNLQVPGPVAVDALLSACVHTALAVVGIAEAKNALQRGTRGLADYEHGACLPPSPPRGGIAITSAPAAKRRFR
jgi:hypothetical protein